jgi:hypothetical protein
MAMSENLSVMHVRNYSFIDTEAINARKIHLESNRIHHQESLNKYCPSCLKKHATIAPFTL